MAKVPIGASLSGGINQFQSPHDIGDDESVSLKNLYPRFPGQLQTRPASAIVGALGGSDGYPLLLHFLPVNAPAALLMYSRAFSKNGTAQYTGMAAYASVGGAAVATSSFGAVTQYVPASIAYQDKVYAFGGLSSNASGKILQKKNTGDVEIVDFVFQGTNNGGVRPSVVGIYRDRFVYGNFGPGLESAFVFADPFLPTLVGSSLFADNSSYGLANPNDGDRITAIHEILLTGQSDVQSSCLVLKEFSAYLLTGEPFLADGVTSPGDGIPALTSNRMPVNCGCSSAQTVCSTPFGLIWAGPDDVWVFPEGQLPYRIGTKIRQALNQSPTNVRYRWHAVFHDGFYKLALFSADQDATDDAPCGEQYWLDLRSGLPQPGPDAWRQCRWYGPMVHTYQIDDSGVSPDYTLGTRCMALDTSPSGTRGLYSAEALEYSPTGYIHLLSYGHASENDCEFETDTATGFEKFFMTRTGISTEIITKEYKQLISGRKLLADVIQEKGLAGVELDLLANRTANIGWRWVLNGGQSIGAEQSVVITPPSGFVLDLTSLDSGVLSTDSMATALDPAPTRVVGRGIQLKIYNLPGIYIDGTNDLFDVVVTVAPAVRTQFTLPIPHGYYSNIRNLRDQIVTLWNAALVPFGLTIGGGYDAGRVQFTLSLQDFAYGLNYLADPATESRVRALAEVLGFSAWDSDYEPSDALTATDVVHPTNAQLWSVGSGMVLWFYTIPRRLL